MFYDRYAALCKGRGISPSRAAEEMGINKASVTNWKKNGYTPRADLLQKIADYFGLSVDQLLGTEKTGASSDAPDDAALKFALFGDTAEIDDADLEDVKRYAAFVKERKLGKKNGAT